MIGKKRSGRLETSDAGYPSEDESKPPMSSAVELSRRRCRVQPARSVETYKRLLAQRDLTRRNDLDGRGNLSEEALVEFTRFFLETCID